MIKENLKQIMDQPMDRKSFLKHVGVGMMAVTGVAAIAGGLLGKGNNSRWLSEAVASNQAYGASTYGDGPAVAPRKVN